MQWTPRPSDGVAMRLTREGDTNRVDFDFHGHGGYAIARRAMNLDLPPNFQFVFRLRGEAPPENLELKLVRGDDVWWLNRRDFVFPREWTTLATKKRQIEFAWGPGRDGRLRHIDSMEVVVTAGSGGSGTVWFTDPELEPLPPTPAEPLTFRAPDIRFDAKRELGGLVIDWARPPHDAWRVLVDGVPHEPGTERFVWLPDAEATEIHVESDGVVRSVTVEPPTWAPTANDFWSIVAKAAKRGDYPRYLIGEQAYWTVIGDDHDDPEALVGEDGNIEPFKGGFSIEPFLIVNGKRLTWADVEITHALAEGDLPIPTVTWRVGGRRPGLPSVSLMITAAVSDSSMLQLRYRVRGTAALRLEARPFQVNPSTQWLNLTGGVSRVDEALLKKIYGRTGGRDRRLSFASDQPGRLAASGGTAVLRIPNASDIEIDVPLRKGARHQPFAVIAAHWRGQLRRVAFDVPADPRVGNTIRTSIAYMLIHRDGAALKPGSRSYERSWIRDGALMAAVLLRFGHAEDAKRFAEWFAKYQYNDGKVPCCVDRRGADPVPENDSHGELIYLIAEIWRLTHDRPFAERLWPHVDAAATYIDKLRAANHGLFEGLVTESISHEGYSAKPMHSYWDDVFALKGLEDAALLAGTLGRDVRAGELAASAVSMRRDVAVSIRRAIDEHHIDYIPGAAELGDFDPTSTAIAISPLNLTPLFPQPELGNTLGHYLRDLECGGHAAALSQPCKSDGIRGEYTPYEMRIIGALIRLGERAPVPSLIERFLKDRRPAAWNEWGEVVRTERRQAGFIGDMPHAWVASDFVRSMLDAVAFERPGGTLVIGAGIPRAWLAKPLHVGPLPTEYGSIDIRMRRVRGHVVIDLTGNAKPPRMIVIAPDGREMAVGSLPSHLELDAAD